MLLIISTTSKLPILFVASACMDPLISCLAILFSCSGDVNNISVGSGTNIQDNSLVHVAKSNLSGKVLPTIIGNNVTVGM